MPISQINQNSLATGVPSATNITTGTLPFARLPTGSVLQVVQNTISTTVQSASSSYVATGLITSITPKFSTSKILVSLNGGTTTYDSGSLMYSRLYRQIASGSYSAIGGTELMSLQGVAYGYPHSLCYLDSPATTSTVNYQPYYYAVNGTGVYFNYQATGGIVSLTLMEIAG
jgi:hypothetical protein